MDSPAAGDTTAGSIASQLGATHLTKESLARVVPGSVTAAAYRGQKFLVLILQVGTTTTHVLRRVQDLYVNVSQMLNVLVLLSLLSADAVNAYVDNMISSPQSTVVDLRGQEPPLDGIWVPFDRAVSVALQFDLYAVVKRLLLVDVHDYEKLPKEEPQTQSPKDSKHIKNETDYTKDSSDNNLSKGGKDEHPLSINAKDKEKVTSDTPRRSSAAQDIVSRAAAANTNAPYAMPALQFAEADMPRVADVKQVFSDIFKAHASRADAEAKLRPILAAGAAADVPLDLAGKTALHYAATLASTDLVGAFVELSICLPVRGDNAGESPLVSMVQVTNAMDKGNFTHMLEWLWPGVFLLDGKHRLVMHVLAEQSAKNARCATYYFNGIIQWLVTDLPRGAIASILNAQDEHGNTALHVAADHELRWFVYVLLELGADPTLPNAAGVKPLDYECIKQIQNFQGPPDAASLGTDEYMIELVRTGAAQLRKMPAAIPANTTTANTGAIVQSIQDLLGGASAEYERVLQQKRHEVRALQRELRDATVATANNRYVLRRIAERIALVDTMKLQMANVTDRLATLQKDSNALFSDDSTLTFDADEPFIIHPIYDRLARGEPVDIDVLELPPADVLRARLRAYQEVNSALERELNTLTDYSALTAKFKKVVSFCTGVDVSEVDDLLDGLLEAVEGQQ